MFKKGDLVGFPIYGKEKSIIIQVIEMDEDPKTFTGEMLAYHRGPEHHVGMITGGWLTCSFGLINHTDIYQDLEKELVKLEDICLKKKI